MKTTRPLIGLRVGLSVGESEDLKNRGFTSAGVNRLAVRLFCALLGKGATLAFGHDWRQEGIMEAVCRGALDAFGFPGEEDSHPLVLNLVPWPDSTRVPREILTRMRSVLAIHGGGLPPDLSKEDGLRHERLDPETRRYFRARGLTHLRKRLTQKSGARICLGGRTQTFQGRYPGILEEGLFALKAGQPLYLVGLLGGAAMHLGRAVLTGETLPDGFGDAAFHEPKNGGRPLAQLYRNWTEKLLSNKQGEIRQSTSDLEDSTLDLEAAWDFAREFGASRLSSNGLSLEENQRLLETDSEEEAIHLVMSGLLRVCEQSTAALS